MTAPLKVVELSSRPAHAPSEVGALLHPRWVCALCAVEWPCHEAESVLGLLEAAALLDGLTVRLSPYEIAAALGWSLQPGHRALAYRDLLVEAERQYYRVRPDAACGDKRRASVRNATEHA